MNTRREQEILGFIERHDYSILTALQANARAWEKARDSAAPGGSAPQWSMEKLATEQMHFWHRLATSFEMIINGEGEVR